MDSIKRGIFFLPAVLLLASVSLPSSADSPEVSPQSTVQLLCDGDLRYLELSGTPYERGLTHGRVLKKEINELLEIWKEDISNTNGMDADEFISLFLAGTDYRPAIERYAPEMLDELKGIADGSEAEYNDLFMFQLVDEYWFNAADLLAGHNCTSIGVDRSRNRPAMTAQNMDIPTFYHGFQMVMKIIEPETGHESLILTFPGHLGITGMNNRGVSINCNTLIQLSYGTEGLPVTYVVRAVTNCTTQEEAIDLVRSARHASGQNYLIGGPERPVSLECSAGAVEEFRPFPGAPFTYHTNHPLVNKDYSGRYIRALEQRGRTVEEGLRTCYRFVALQNRFDEHGANITIEDIKGALGSRDNESDPISNRGTFAGVIYELGERPSLHIAAGKPHEKKYFIIEF